MGVILDPTNCHKSTDMIFTKQTAIVTGLRFSSEMLYILVAQGAAKLQEIKVEGSINFYKENSHKEYFWTSHFDSPQFYSPLSCKNA